MTIHEPLGFTRPVDPSKGNRTQMGDRSGVAAGHEGRDHLAVSDRALALYETEKAQRLDEIRDTPSPGLLSGPACHRRYRRCPCTGYSPYRNGRRLTEILHTTFRIR